MPEADVVVIGGGVSGMIAAIRLQQAGLQTLLLEQNHQLGGLAAGIERKGFYFDVGCQSVINGGILFPLLEQLGLADDRWRRARFRVVAQEGDYDFEADGLSQVRDQLSRGDPRAGPALRTVFRQHELAARAIDAVRTRHLAQLRAGRGGLLQRAGLLAGLAWPLLRCHAGWRERYEDFYARTLPPGPARSLLTSLGYPGMSTFFAGAVWDCWSHDYWYPRGGLQCWFDALGRHFGALGGDLRFKSRVERLLCSHGRCSGVELADGRRITARATVASADLGQVLGRLVPADQLRPRERRQLAALRATPLTTPLLACYVGLSWPPAELRRRMGAAHLFHVPMGASSLPLPGADGHLRCWIQIAAHSAFEPDADAAGAGSSVVVQCFTDPAWQNRFGVGDAAALPRPRAYQDLTLRLRADLIQLLDRALPGAAEAVVYADVGTPLSTERFTRSPLGSSAGFSWFLPDVPVSALGWRRGLRRLFACGQTTIWPGSVALSALSGKIAADLAIQDIARGG
jgi:phytoene dehydrogenase-like protein